MHPDYCLQPSKRASSNSLLVLSRQNRCCMHLMSNQKSFLVEYTQGKATEHTASANCNHSSTPLTKVSSAAGRASCPHTMISSNVPSVSRILTGSSGSASCSSPWSCRCVIGSTRSVGVATTPNSPHTQSARPNQYATGPSQCQSSRLSRTSISIRKGNAPTSKFSSPEMRRLCIIWTLGQCLISVRSARNASRTFFFFHGCPIPVEGIDRPIVVDSAWDDIWCVLLSRVVLFGVRSFGLNGIHVRHFVGWCSLEGFTRGEVLR
jgi:hypothetical protein